VIAAAISGSKLARRWNTQNDLPGAHEFAQPATLQGVLPLMLRRVGGKSDQKRLK